MRPVASLVVAAGLCSAVAAHAATPRAPAAPSPAAQASPGEPPEVRSLAMLRQVAASLEESVASGDLAAVHYEDMFLYSAVGQLGGSALAAGRTELHRAVGALARAVSDLHAAADAFDREACRARLASAAGLFDGVRSFFEPAALAAADALAERFTCPMHPEVIGRRGEACAKCGMSLDARSRVKPHDQPSTGVLPRIVDATIRTEAPLAAGTEVGAVLKLTALGAQPLALADLREVHTRKIHLLIVDESLTDYHHEHPTATQTPGEYRFRFTPRRPGRYRAWADVQPLLTGLQEYARAEVGSVPGAGGALEKTYPGAGELEGLRYELSLDGGPARARQPIGARVHVSGAGGRAFAGLEPLMGAFAHLVGFHEDRRTILHMHPLESRRLAPEDRGGPDLSFRIYAETPGYYRLFLQVQVGGQSKFVPFGLEVAP